MDSLLKEVEKEVSNRIFAKGLVDRPTAMEIAKVKVRCLVLALADQAEKAHMKTPWVVVEKFHKEVEREESVQVHD